MRRPGETEKSWTTFTSWTLPGVLPFVIFALLLIALLWWTMGANRTQVQAQGPTGLVATWVGLEDGSTVDCVVLRDVYVSSVSVALSCDWDRRR